MNRIHMPLQVKVKKTPSIINFKKDISSNNTETFISSDTNLLENIEEFKARMEQDILELKSKIENINTVRNNNRNIQGNDTGNNNENNVENNDGKDTGNNDENDIENVLNLVNNLTSHIEEYKKITNERIEKLVKLFLIINAKVSSIKTD